MFLGKCCFGVHGIMGQGGMCNRRKVYTHGKIKLLTPSASVYSIALGTAFSFDRLGSADFSGFGDERQAHFMAFCIYAVRTSSCANVAAYCNKKSHDCNTPKFV